MLNPLVGLPTAPVGRVAVHLTSDALRHVRSGHPWVWEGSITRTSVPGATGDFAVVFDGDRKFAAIGLWDPYGAIAVRLLHHGAPLAIDARFFTDRLIDAYALRQSLHDDPLTTAYRLVHGENDRLPGLVIDRYVDTLVIKLDTVAWWPHLHHIIPSIVELSDAERVIVRASRRIEAQLPMSLRENPTVVGDRPTEPIMFSEHDLLFEADVLRGQKTGHFLDQRDNRQLVASRCHDAKVLDVFCNTGGFSVHAAAAGARSVHSVDISRYAIDATRRHLELNRARSGFRCDHSTTTGDAFEAMATLIAQGKSYDVVIVDPPTFAPNAAALPAARQAYRRLTALASELLASGGTLFQASCSSRVTAPEFYGLVNDELADQNVRAINIVRTGHSVDHPIGFPEGAYLKAVLCDIIPSP